MTAPPVLSPPVLRALARLDLVLARLSKAKDSNPENFCPLEIADAEALYGLVWDAEEDLQELREATLKSERILLRPENNPSVSQDAA